MTLNNLAVVFAEGGDVRTALFRGAAVRHTGHAVVLKAARARAQAASAARYLREALDVAVDAPGRGRSSGRVKTILNLAALLERAGDHAAAEACRQEAAELSSETGS